MNGDVGGIMELIYLWVKEFRNISNTGFNFTSNFHVEFKNKVINISAENDRPKIYDGKIDQITAIIGKNGSGKTNILDLLGAKRFDRQGLGNSEGLKYFIIYHLEGNQFAIEGSDFNYISNNISKYPDDTDMDAIKEPYSIVIDQIDGKLIYNNLLQYANKEDGRGGINYFNHRHHFSGNAYGHYASMQIERDYSHLFNRVNLNKDNTGLSATYRMLCELNKQNVDIPEKIFMFNYRHNAKLIISKDMYLNHDIDLNLEKGFHEKFNILRDPIMDDQPKFSKRVDFINCLLYEYCHYLAAQFYQLPEMKEDLLESKEKIQKITIQENDWENYYFSVLKVLLNQREEKGKKNNYYNERSIIKKVIKGIVQLLSNFQEDWFNEDNINVPIEHGEFQEEIAGLLELLDDVKMRDGELQSLLKIFKVKFIPFSSGEEALMSLFSSLYHGIQSDFSTKKNKAIILLDEPEIFLHPEWCRLFISELSSFLNRLDNGYESYQLIITTHSPFIATDLPGSDIIALTQDDETGVCKKVDISQSFASNIHTLLAQDFFMDSTIGEFAKQKINYVIDLLRHSDELTELQKKEVEYIISITGEPLIKNQLAVMAQRLLQQGETIAQLKSSIVERENDDRYNK